MRISLVLAVIVACALGCTGEGDGRSGREGLSSNEPDPGQPPPGCETVCQSYDSSDCRVVCPPEPPDASVPTDPYAQ